MSDLSWLYRDLKTFLSDRSDPDEKQRKELQFVAHLARRMIQTYEDDEQYAYLAGILEDIVDSCAFRGAWKDDARAQEVTRKDIATALMWIVDVIEDD